MVVQILPLEPDSYPQAVKRRTHTKFAKGEGGSSGGPGNFF